MYESADTTLALKQKKTAVRIHTSVINMCSFLLQILFFSLLGASIDELLNEKPECRAACYAPCTGFDGLIRLA